MKKILGALLALALTTVGMVGLSAPASATYKNLTCSVATLQPHRALTNGDHINMEIVQDGRTFQVNAYVDRNVPGGHGGLGVRVQSGARPAVSDVYPLTKAEVQSGIFTFNYAKYISGVFTVKWVQFNNTYFNQDRSSEGLNCGTKPPVEEPPVTPEPPKVTKPQIQDYIGSCDVETREAKFVLDNIGSNVDVTYVVDGTSYVVDAGKGLHVTAGPVPAEGKTYVITAGDKRWEFRADACEIPEPPVVDIDAAPAASITATCGAAEIALTNPEDDDAYTNRLTASFVIYVDGTFYDAYAVAADASETVSLTFPEDSGDHKVEVRTGPAFGDVLLDSATVTSDCVPPVVTPEPTDPPTTEEPTDPEPTDPPTTEEPTEPTEPTKPSVKPTDGPKKPATPVRPSKAPQAAVKAPAASAPASQKASKVAAPKSESRDLAHTGSDPLLGALLGSLLVISGVGVVALKRRRTN